MAKKGAVMKLTIIKSTLLSVCLLLSTSTFANFICTDVNVNSVTILKDGKVRVNFSKEGISGAANPRFCDLDEEYQSVSPTTCAVWTSTAQRARKDNSTLNIFYTTSNYNSCSEFIISTDDNLSPNYLYVNTQGNTGSSGGNTGSGGNGGNQTLTTSPSGLTTVTATITSTSADLSWTNSGSQNWLELRDPSGTLLYDLTLGAASEHNFTGLTSGTTYDAKLYIEGAPNYPNVTFQFTTQ